MWSLFIIHISQYNQMMRRTSKMSFWVLRPTDKDERLQIQLPLISSRVSPLDGPEGHQIRSLMDFPEKNGKELPWDPLLRKYGVLMDSFGGVIGADSTPLLIWNILIFLLVYFNLVEIPIALMVQDSYKESNQVGLLVISYSIALDLFLVDMVAVRTRISYEDEGRILVKSQEILRFYLRRYFWWDLIGVLAMAASFIPIKGIDFIRLLLIVKLISLREINRQIKSKLLTHSLSLAVYDFFKLVFFIGFVTNVYACIYYAIDTYYYYEEGEFYQQGFLWINGSLGLGNIDLMETFGPGLVYVYALFWSLQTGRTCGYGVATPKNYVQILYVNFVMLTIIVLFVYFANGVVTLILANSQLRRVKFNRIKKAVDAALQLGLRKDMKEKVIEYISDLQNPEEEMEDNMEVLLSPVLRNQFKLAFRSHFLNLVSLVSLVADDEREAQLFRIDLANSIKHRHYQERDVIFQSKQITEGRLLLIQRGACKVYNDSVGYKKYQNEWSLIGRREFYFATIPILTVVAKEYISGLELTRTDFLGCLKAYRQFYEKYIEFIQGITIGKHETEEIFIKCAFCNLSHMHEHCPMINLWRSELRIKRIGHLQPEQSGVNERRKTVRQERSAKIMRLFVERIELDKVHRTTHYFNHYNI